MKVSRAVAAMLATAVIGTIGLGWTTPSGAQRGARVGQPAPEITGSPWINSEPLSMAKLRGRVVLVEFWTYG
jgi:hypothetical protein